MKLCQTCNERETTGPKAKYCAECRRAKQEAQGRKMGKATSASGRSHIFIMPKGDD